MSLRIYPVSGKELCHDGYEVKINGKVVALDAARVSAIPYNRRWPGHQRTEDPHLLQTNEFCENIQIEY